MSKPSTNNTNKSTTRGGNASKNDSGTVSSFDQGVEAFKRGRFEDAVAFLTEAIDGAPTLRALDSRAAALAKLGRHKEALRDARASIKLAPDACQGYARAARVFAALQQWDKADAMAQHAAAKSSRLAGLPGEIEAQRAECAHLLRYTACHAAVLPVELLTAVFVAVVATAPDAVLRLNGVCRHWRTVARGAPALWHGLQVGSTRPQRKIALWLEMARGSLWDVHVTDSSAAWTAFNSVHADHRLHGLKKLSMRLPKPADHDIDILAAFSSLEDLHLRAEGCAITRIFECTPRLRRLQLEFDEWLTWDETTIIPEHLLELAIHTTTNIIVSRGPILDVLRANPKLVSLTYDVKWIILSTVVTTGMVELPSLTNLTLSVHGSRFLLPYLLFPAVTHLTLGCCPEAESALRDLPCVAQLESLVLSQWSLPFADIIGSLLSGASHLAQLTLTGSPLDEANTLVEQLASEPALAPALTALDLSGCSALRGGPLVRLVRARRGRIQELRVDSCERVEAEVLPWLKQEVPRVSCVYITKKQARGKRWLG